MNSIRDLLLSLCTIFFCLHAAAAGGFDVGNGTDNPAPETGSAWFLGDEKTFSYCVEVAPGFGPEKTSLESAIEATLTTWRDYIRAHEIQKLLAGDSGGRNLSLRWSRRATCDDKEDLKLDFGGDDVVIRQEKVRLDHPVAFALRTDYEPRAGWGHGLIWFSPPHSISTSKKYPDWSVPATLERILLHELGHVFGVLHVRNTIMDADLSGQLLRGENVLPQIDQRNQLVACWRCQTYKMPGQLGYSDPRTKDFGAKVFRRFVGRAPKGPIHAELQGSPTSFKLTITDDGGRRAVDLNVDQDESAIHTGFDRGERIFKIAWLAEKETNMRTADIFNGGVILYGAVLDAARKPLNLVVEVNSHSLASPGPITLRWLESGKAHALFFADRAAAEH